MKSLLSEKQQKEASATLLKEMESISLNMRELCPSLEPH
jgi:hypothetical protein